MRQNAGCEIDSRCILHIDIWSILALLRLEALSIVLSFKVKLQTELAVLPIHKKHLIFSQYDGILIIL